jgi:hypothetical protein
MISRKEKIDVMVFKFEDYSSRLEKVNFKF